MSIDQVTALMDDKRVIGPAKDILEVKNAIKTYNDIRSFSAFSETDYLKAHSTLMSGLIDQSGSYRTSGVGIVKGNQVAHLAPPAWNVPLLMRDLFAYIKDDRDS